MEAQPLYTASAIEVETRSFIKAYDHFLNILKSKSRISNAQTGKHLRHLIAYLISWINGSVFQLYSICPKSAYSEDHKIPRILPWKIMPS